MITTKKDVGSQLNGLAALTGQIEERKRYILTINNDVESIERELSSLERQLTRLQRDLRDKKKKYESSVQYLYKNRSIEEKLMFIFLPRAWHRPIDACAMYVNMLLISACKARKC